MKPAACPLRILEAVSQNRPNGAIIYARRIIPMLRARGHEVFLLAMPGSWIAKETANEATQIETSFARWPLTEARRIAEICRRERIDLVHSHLTRAGNFAALLRSLHGVRSVAHAHSHHFQPHWWFHNLVIAASKATLQTHRRRLAARGERGHVLHNFVDAVRYAPAEKTPDILRAELRLPADTPVIVHVAERVARKGQNFALQAAARIREVIPNVHFAFIGADSGDTDYIEKLHSYERDAQLGGCVHWLGLRKDVPQLLPHASLAILPSLNEPFALAGLEAMACGVPLIASDTGGFPEMIAHGENGLLVRPGDAASLANAILELLKNPERRAAMGRAARERMLREFAAEPHIARLETLFEKTLKRG